MKVESKLFLYLMLFFLIVGVIYAYFTYSTGDGEWVGIVALLLTAAMSGLISWYLAKSGRTVDFRPEDNPEGEIADQAGPYGHFSPHSWWPFWLALSAAVLFLGIAIGWWMVIIAVPFVALATVGWTFEYFHGEKAV
ncbi:MAG TPA: cytochrome c oxidase subunit 4 [Ornithinicoccus sp.]|nr:cytochrome c oxidase subunit 4 [Ornithinicoccus sp.]